MRGVKRTSTVVEIVHENMTPEQLVPPDLVSRFVPVYQAAAGSTGGAEPMPVEHLEQIIRAELEKAQAESAAMAEEGRGGSDEDGEEDGEEAGGGGGKRVKADKADEADEADEVVEADASVAIQAIRDDDEAKLVQWMDAGGDVAAKVQNGRLSLLHVAVVCWSFQLSMNDRCVVCHHTTTPPHHHTATPPTLAHHHTTTPPHHHATTPSTHLPSHTPTLPLLSVSTSPSSAY